MNVLTGTELILIALGVSMDAFAVAICKGLSFKKNNIKKALIVGLYFGIFQAGMPLLGYMVGIQFQSYIIVIDHWIAFLLLGAIGINMVKESQCDCDSADDSLDFKSMSILAIATSIDALAVGVTLACLQVNIVTSASFIGMVTLILSIIGVKIGSIFGIKYKSKAELFGGIILLIVAIKILLEHLFH